MLAYSKKSLDNLQTVEAIDDARRKRLITLDEYAVSMNAHRIGLYSPNLFIRIGLFVATCLMVFFSMGFVYLVMPTNFVTSLLYGLVVYGALEYFVRMKKHYRSGVDDALLWFSLSTIAVSLLVWTNMNQLPAVVTVFILSLYGSLRFANSVMSAVAFISFVLVIFYALSPFGNFAKAILPFVVMIVSLVTYWLSHSNRKKFSLRHYRYCLLMIEFLSLITAYASVNYFVVTELSIAMFGLPANATLPGSFLFWIATYTFPAVYIARGLYKKDALLLRTGLLLVVATVFTFRYYYSLAPIEQVMTVGGLLMIGVAYFAIRYLTVPRNGVVDLIPEEAPTIDEKHLESLVVAETFKPETILDQGFKFGGGSAGGGGATGQF